MRTVRFELEVEVDEQTVEDYDGDAVAAAEEILHDAPAFDRAYDIKEELTPVVDRHLIVQERIPDYDEEEAFTQEWHFRVVDGVAYFRELTQGGETYRSEPLSQYVREIVSEMGYTVRGDE